MHIWNYRVRAEVSEGREPVDSTEHAKESGGWGKRSEDIFYAGSKGSSGYKRVNGILAIEWTT